MEPFKFTVRPGTVESYNGRPMHIFCTVDYDGKRLSISGVEGPLPSGNCIGSCGQIDMHLREPGALDSFKPADGWTLESFRHFLDVWNRWHLNDMRAYDSEMEAAGWPELAKREILIYEYTMTAESSAAKKAAESAAMEALKAGATFTPTPAQVAAAMLPYFAKVYQYPENGEPETPDGYERAKHYSSQGGGLKAPERKTLGWIRPDEHADGLLTRKLRPDGPGYGSAWFKEEIPADVLEYLANLPRADRPNPWRD